MGHERHERDLRTDDAWAQLAPLLPPQKPRTGRPAKAHRPVVEGLLWLARTGAAWRDLPPVYGAWISPDRSSRRWTANGLWPRILRALQEGEADG